MELFITIQIVMETLNLDLLNIIFNRIFNRTNPTQTSWNQ